MIRHGTSHHGCCVCNHKLTRNQVDRIISVMYISIFPVYRCIHGSFLGCKKLVERMSPAFPYIIGSLDFICLIPDQGLQRCMNSLNLGKQHSKFSWTQCSPKYVQNVVQIQAGKHLKSLRTPLFGHLIPSTVGSGLITVSGWARACLAQVGHVRSECLRELCGSGVVTMGMDRALSSPICRPLNPI